MNTAEADTDDSTGCTDHQQQTILIIEDNQYDYLLMKHIILSQYPDINILYAECLGDAYEVYKNHSYDFVLLDLNLPDGYGTGTIQEVKKFHGHTPIIIISGAMTDAIESNALRMGASAVMSKDTINKPAFLSMIKAAIGHTKKEHVPYNIEFADQYEERHAFKSRSD